MYGYAYTEVSTQMTEACPQGLTCLNDGTRGWGSTSRPPVPRLVRLWVQPSAPFQLPIGSCS